MLDYVRVVRSHWLIAAAAFLLVFGLKVWDALVAEPVYEARAILQVERFAPGQEGGVSPYASLSLTLITAAELEVLRSFPVAQIAAEDPGSDAVASIEELNEYRPLEVALRSFGKPRKPCRIAVSVRPLERGETVLRLAFDDTGRGIRVTVPGGREVARLGPDDWAFAEPFEDKDGNHRWNGDEDYADLDKNGAYDPGRPLVIGKDEVRLALLQGDPAGRTFVLTRRSLDKAAHWLQEGVTAREVTQHTGIMSVGFRAPSPIVSANAANALARAYEAYKREKQSSEVERRTAFLDQEVAKIKGKLEEAEADRDEYVSREGGTVLLGEQANSLLSKQRELAQEKLDLIGQQRLAEWKLDELGRAKSLQEKLLAATAEAADPLVTALTSELTPLQTERNVLLALEKATKENERILALDARISEIQGRLTAQLDMLIERRRSWLQAEKGRIQLRLDRVESELADLKTDFETLPIKEREYIRKTRPIERYEEAFNDLSRSLMQSKIVRESLVSRVYILDPAVRNSNRQSPKVTSTGIVAIILGLLAAAIAAFLREYMIRTISSPQVLEDELGLTLYTAVPRYGSVRRRERRGLKRGRSLVTVDVPHSVLAEAYRTLRANVKFASPEGAPRTLAITSALDQEGKSVTTLNLAVVMAQAGDRVLVVDADMRRPTTHLYFGAEQAPGLVEVLSGEARWQDVVRRMGVEGLHVIHAGRATENPSALLDSSAFQDFLAAVRDAYDYVLFDVPPVLAVADASAFFRQLDGILLLTRYRRCTLDAIDGALAQVERLGGRILGVVFNGFDARASARRGTGYYGYYGYYSRYGGYRARGSQDRGTDAKGG